MPTDPTYDKDEIESNAVWHAAWVLSENFNDNAPIGWGKYIKVADAIDRAGLLVKNGRDDEGKT